jgi:hypothetical protein
VVVNDVQGCSGTVQFVGACIDQPGNSDETLDLGDDCKVTWVKGDGISAVVVNNNNGASGSSWTIRGCRDVSEGGSQCAPSGGGCDI